MFKSNNQLTPGYTLSSITPSGGLIVGKDFKFSTGTLDPQCRGKSVPSRVSNRLLAMHGHNRPTSVQIVLYTSKCCTCFIVDVISDPYPNKGPVYSKKMTCKKNMFRLYKWRLLCAVWR